MTLLKAIREKISDGHGRQMAVFGSVGLLCTITDLLLFTGFVAAGLYPVIANFFSFLVANGQGYVLNGVLTFRKGGKRSPLSLKGYARFFTGYLFALVFSTAIIWFFADRLGPVIAKVIAIAFTALWNYVISAFFVFRQPQSNEESRAPEST